MRDPTPSPTLSDPESDITELADERNYGKVEEELEEELEDLDAEIFAEDGASEPQEGQQCPRASEGQDPFYDRWPLFSLVGRLVRLQEFCCCQRKPALSH